MASLPAVTTTRLGRAVQREINQLALEGPVEIPLIVGHVLEMPDQLAGVGIERQRGVGVQAIVVNAGLLRRMHQRAGVVSLRRSEEDQVQRGIIAAGGPNRRAAALFERQAVPTVAAGLDRDARWCRNARLPCRWRRPARRSYCRPGPVRRCRRLPCPWPREDRRSSARRGFFSRSRIS